MRIEHIKQPELKGEISIDERLLFRITTIIEEHIDNSDLSVEMLSRLMGISQKQLLQEVKVSHLACLQWNIFVPFRLKKPPYCSKMETFPWRKLYGRFFQCFTSPVASWQNLARHRWSTLGMKKNRTLFLYSYLEHH